MTPINALYNRLLAAEPTIDIRTMDGRLTALTFIDPWLAYAGECLAQCHALRRSGKDNQQAAKAMQQWFNLTIQIGELHQWLDDANTQQAAVAA